MAAAQLASVRSKDPSLKVGAAILDRKNRLVSTGYNGLPRGVPDDGKMLSVREIKLDLTIHAEENAILFAQRDLEGCTIYVWPAPPCARCAAKIAQVGINRVVAQTPTADYLSRWGKSCDLAEWVYAHAGIEYVEMSL
ncbi:MAG: dCMP deaminase family protein [Gammaproteobacteria bacterium]|nr:dCMP deaminase family protein [Gammaproteobacteria bacterium]